MDRIIIWTEPAKKDIQQITIYWNNRNKSYSYSIKLRKIIRDKLRFISRFPLIGIQTDYPDVRCFIIRDYKLFYFLFLLAQVCSKAMSAWRTCAEIKE